MLVQLDVSVISVRPDEWLSGSGLSRQLEWARDWVSWLFADADTCRVLVA